MGSQPVTLLVQLREHRKYTHLETFTHTEPSLWSPLQGIIKCKCSSDITQYKQGKTQNSQYKHKHITQQSNICRPWSIPSRGTLEFLALSLSSDVSLLTALPLLVLRSTLNARFNLLKERLLTEDRSKFLTVKETGEKERHFIDYLILNMPRHAWICLLTANQMPSHCLMTICWCVAIGTGEEMKYLYDPGGPVCTLKP